MVCPNHIIVFIYFRADNIDSPILRAFDVGMQHYEITIVAGWFDVYVRNHRLFAGANKALQACFLYCANRNHSWRYRAHPVFERYFCGR